MAKAGGSVSTGGATRLVYVIGMLKWIAMVVIALGVAGARPRLRSRAETTPSVPLFPYSSWSTAL